MGDTIYHYASKCALRSITEGDKCGATDDRIDWGVQATRIETPRWKSSGPMVKDDVIQSPFGDIKRAEMDIMWPGYIPPHLASLMAH